MQGTYDVIGVHVDGPDVLAERQMMANRSSATIQPWLDNNLHYETDTANIKATGKLNNSTGTAP